MNPHKVTKDFEQALCEYTGAPYAVVVTSCTAALTLAVAWKLFGLMSPRGVMPIEIPRRTYVGVPYAIREAGGRPTFRDEDWSGAYQLKPLPIWDSARWFTRDLYRLISGRHAMATGQLVCTSFHATKTLSDTQGGAILHDDLAADRWLRRARFDGRTEGVPPSMDKFELSRAWHCYISPDVALRLMWHLQALKPVNPPLPNDDYPDLSTMEVFK